MKEDKTIYGKHLMLRIGEVEKFTNLKNENEISNFLKLLISRIGMRVLAGPLVGHENGDELTEGCSGIILLYESHAAIHTYINQKEAFIDIFSCKEFEKQIVLTVISEIFGNYTVIEEQTLTRGHHWNKGLTSEFENWKSKK